MALISCTECGQQISDKAAVCPRCGSPASTSSNPIRDSVIQVKKHCLMRFKNFLHEFVRLHHPRGDRASLLLRLQQIFLTKLANSKLKDEGIISSEEFEAKKTELLRKLYRSFGVPA